jgi:hypothetical protein
LVLFFDLDLDLGFVFDLDLGFVFDLDFGFVFDLDFGFVFDLDLGFVFDLAFCFFRTNPCPRVPHPCAFCAQEPALSEAEGVGFHSTAPLGI